MPDPLDCHDEQEKFFAAVGQGKTIKYTDPAPADPTMPRTETIVTHTIEDPQRPIKREVKSIYRLKQGEDQFVYYVEYLAGETFSGIPYDKHRIVGRYDEPEFSRERNRESGSITITGIRDHTTIHEIPFTTGEFEDPSTGEKTTLEKLPKSQDLKLYIRVGQNRPYELAGMSLEDFMSRSFEDLMFYAKNNNKWPESKPVVGLSPEAQTTVKGKKATVSVKAETE